jgi:TRAP-type C4-dicarboxylate transport system permease large subunit
VQGIRKPGDGDITDVIKGAIPFVISMFTMIALLLWQPQIALWLPEQFY